MLNPHSLRNINCFIDGKGYAGAIESIKLPTLAIKTEDYNGGGLDADIELDMGMEKLEAEIVINRNEADLFKGFGLNSSERVNYTIRAAYDEDGTVRPVVIKMAGGTKSITRDDQKSGMVAKTTLAVSLRYYEESIDGTTVARIDVDNNVREINGVDQLADIRAAIGV